MLQSPTSQRNILPAMQMVIDRLFENSEGRQRRVDFGASSIVFSAAASSATVTIPHRLGVVPIMVVATAGDLQNNVFGPVLAVGTFTELSFQLRGRDTDATARSITIPVYWLAIG